jgi:hypothetical protein
LSIAWVFRCFVGELTDCLQAYDRGIGIDQEGYVFFFSVSATICNHHRALLPNDMHDVMLSCPLDAMFINNAQASPSTLFSSVIHVPELTNIVFVWTIKASRSLIQRISISSFDKSSTTTARSPNSAKEYDATYERHNNNDYYGILILISNIIISIAS